MFRSLTSFGLRTIPHERYLRVLRSLMCKLITPPSGEIPFLWGYTKSSALISTMRIHDKPLEHFPTYTLLRRVKTRWQLQKNLMMKSWMIQLTHRMSQQCWQSRFPPSNTVSTNSCCSFWRCCFGIGLIPCKSFTVDWLIKTHFIYLQLDGGWPAYIITNGSGQKRYPKGTTRKIKDKPTPVFLR